MTPGRARTVVGALIRPAREADLDPDVCINEHSQRNPGTMVGAAMVSGMIVRRMSALDPEAAEKACTTGFIHRCLACVRARGGHFEHRWTGSRGRVFFLVSFDLS